MTGNAFFQLRIFLLFGVCSQFSFLYGQQSVSVFEEQGRFGLKDSADQVLIDPKYENLGWYPEEERVIRDFLGYQQRGSWGLISISGKKLTPAKFYSIGPFSDELFLVSTRESLSNRLNYGLIDTRGKQVLSNAYFHVSKLDELILVSEYTQGDQLYGLYNRRFQVVLPPAYLEIRKFKQLILAKGNDDRWICFDSMGRRILDTTIDSFEVIGGFLVIDRNGAKGLLDLAGGTLKYRPVNKGFHGLPESPEPIPPQKWSVYDRELNFLLDLEADSLSDFGDVMVAMMNGGQRLYSDSSQILEGKSITLQQVLKGYVVIRTKDQFEAFNDEGKQLAKGDSIHFDGSYFFVLEKHKWRVVNVFGRQINQYPLEDVMVSQENYIPVKRAGQWGLLDFSGELIVPHVYDSIGVGFGASFPVEYVGSWGVINPFGNWLIQPAYQSINRLSDLYVGEKRGAKTLLTRKGKNLYTTPDDLKLGNASIEVIHDEGKGLITTDGVVIFDPIYDQVRHLGDFYMAQRAEGAVIKDGLGAFIVRLDDRVAEVLDYSEEFFLIKKDGLYGFIDERGRIRIANRYDSARHFREEMAPIKLIGKWGFIDKSERLVVQPQYKEVGDFYHGRAIVHQDFYGLIDLEGRKVLEMAFRSISRTKEGSYILEDKNGRKGLANELGEIILTPSFDNMRDIGNGLIIAERKDKKGIYDHSGKLMMGFDYSEIISAGSYIFMLPIRQ